MVRMQVRQENRVDVARLDPRGIKLGNQVALDAPEQSLDSARVGCGSADPGVNQNGLSLGAYQVAFEVGPYVVGAIERLGVALFVGFPIFGRDVGEGHAQGQCTLGVVHDQDFDVAHSESNFCHGSS